MAHSDLGLYFVFSLWLFFFWLFALTGRLLNHSWAFTGFWTRRRPRLPHPLTRADHLMRQFPAPRQSPRVDLPSTSAHDEKNNK